MPSYNAPPVPHSCLKMTFSRSTVGVLSVALLSLFSLAACDGGSSPTAVKDDSAQATGSVSPAVVWRGDTRITMTDIDAWAQRVPVEHRGGLFDDPARIETVLRQILLTKELSAKGRAAGLEEDPVVAAQAQLAADEVIASRYDEGLQASEPPDFSVLAKERYLAEPEAFRRPKFLEVQHILITDRGRTADEARGIAEDLRDRIQRGRISFDDAVAQYSDEPGVAETRGVIPNVEAGQTEPAFDAAIFKLEKAGEIAPIIQTSHGFHVVQLVGIQGGDIASFDEVSGQIVNDLEVEWRTEQGKGLRTSLADEPLEADPALVASLRTRYLTPGKDAAAAADGQGGPGPAMSDIGAPPTPIAAEQEMASDKDAGAGENDRSAGQPLDDAETAPAKDPT